MPQVEVYLGEADAPLFVSRFDFLPRLGETVSKDAGGYFTYYEVIEVWHREAKLGHYCACISVKLND